MDADIEVNAQHFRWADLKVDGQIDAETADLQNTLVHEFGHFIGLDHTCYLSDETSKTDDKNRPSPLCDTAPRDVKETTMYASVTES